MITKYMINVLLITLLMTFTIIKSIKAGCMSARNMASDTDCYLNHLARENVMRMGLEGGCDAPRPQVVYPDDSNKVYMPRGTLLYRCNDQSGCCPQKEHSCLPLQEDELRVAFYAVDCMGGESRPQPEYVIMKNHTKCGCRPKQDDGYDSPQRYQNNVCAGGQSRYQMRGQSQYGGGYGGGSGQSGGYGGGGGGQYGGGGQSYGGQQRGSSPCANSMSSRPLMDGQVVRGTIRLTVGPKGFMQSQQQYQTPPQQQPCPYG